MTERPMLLFPEPTTGGRRKRPSPGGLAGPGHAAQRSRVAPRLQQLRDECSQQRHRLQATPNTAYPEDVVVFEVADSVQNFVAAVRNAEGLSWLAEAWDPDLAPDDWSRRDRPVDRRLYFIGATERGIAELLRLWALYSQNPDDIPRGHRAWVPLFNQLIDVRRYSRIDRLTAETLDELETSVAHGEHRVVVEVELWYRRGPAGARGVGQAVEALGGQILVEAKRFGPAGVLLMLVELPARAVRQLREDPGVVLAELTQVRALRAGPQTAVEVPGEPVDGRPPQPAYCLDREPVVAVFDGVPMENHEALQGAILVEDPHNLAAETPVSGRNHGTAVASVAIWRDLDRPAPQPARPIYVRPIMHDHEGLERCPADRILADMISEAIETMPRSIAVVNLSIGVRNREYDGREPSSLARVLDALAWQYKVLFIVAAGNYDPRHDVLQLNTRDGEDGDARHRAILQSVRDGSDIRRVLSPAESMNALTVGAIDDDDTRNTRPRWVPAWNTRGPALYSRMGRGHRRANKPDLVAPGGRQPLQLHARGSDTSRALPFEYTQPVRRFGGIGVAVASPGMAGSATRGKRFVRGTSFAAPRVTHAAALLSDSLDSLAASTGRDLFAVAPRSLWLKCLLVHCSSRKDLESWAEPDEDPSDLLDRTVGFGELDHQRLGSCARERFTIIAGGELHQDQAHRYGLPLPNCLRGLKSFNRSLRVTVAWYAPPWPTSSFYRGAKLTLETLDTKGLSFKSREVNHHIESRGTIIHQVRHGRGRATYAPGTEIDVTVGCQADAMKHVDEPVPYVIATTLEVEPELEVDIYQEVRQRLAVPIRART